jgi:uncharacterized LabA/DUF88 family protein
VPRFYLRQLRAGLTVLGPPRVYAGVPAPPFAPSGNGHLLDQEPQPDAIPEYLEATMPSQLQEPPDSATVSTGEGSIEPGEAPATPARRRRRRRRRGRAVSVANEPTPSNLSGDIGGLSVTDVTSAGPLPADQQYVPDIPPSSFLAEMVQRGDLILPERGRRRRAAAEATETSARDGAAAPGARPSGQRLSPIEEMIARQNVLFDQLLQRQTALLKAVERMMTVLERRGGGLAGGGGTFSPMPRVAIFVDVPNIVYAAERLGVQIDWGKVLNYLTRDRQLVRATAYAPISDDTFQRLETQKFVQPFYNLPYRILTKPLKRFGNGEIKANFDVELAIDALTMADRLDIICLVSGDGDFRRMVELVQAKGVRVEVVAFGASTAGELRVVADDFIDIGQHLHEFTVTK